MNRRFAAAALLPGAVLLYLLAWPVPIEPVSWAAPVDRGLVDPFELNDQLQFISGIDLGEFAGPEDAAIGSDGRIYVTTLSGHVIRIEDGRVAPFAFPDGRPLGIEALPDGGFVVANAFLGLQRIASNGTVTTLLDEVFDQPLVYANNLAVGPDGIVLHKHLGPLTPSIWERDFVPLIEAGADVANLCVLGNLSYVLGRKLQWDRTKQTIVGDQQAQRMMSRPQRHPYHL